MNGLGVGVVQMAMGPSAPHNIETARRLVIRAASMGARIILLPELYKTPYFCTVEDVAHFDLAEPLEGESFAAFSPVAREQGVWIVVPIFERRAAGIYHNSVILIGPDGTRQGLYRKTHIPDDPGFHEKHYFTPGDLGYPVFDVGGIKVAVLICWDQWYPEAARLVALKGAQVIFYPTAIGWTPSEKEGEGAMQHDAWRTVQRGHAVANGLTVAVANRCGYEPTPGGEGIEFWGGSFIAGPMGEIVAEAGEEETVLVTTVDPAASERIRRIWPFFRDRRIDLFGPLTQRFIDDEEPRP
ncbi:MAG: carbon-nitrogen hydrolase [Nitrospinae bacterium]|nr:carbon-nitrogen hydrolase [Nitrospinota bacterium]